MRILIRSDSPKIELDIQYNKQVTRYKLLFMCEERAAISCTSSVLRFKYKLRK